MRTQLLERVRESNRQAADAWHRWASHRAHVMDVLAQVACGAGRLCVLGAGHLNDLSLDALRERYRAFTLVDLDVETVLAGLERHDPRHERGCEVAPPVDLTGIIDQLPRVACGELGVDDLLGALEEHQCVVPSAPFDVTASLGVLTQLLQTVVDAGLPAAEVPRVSLATRDKHLRDLLRLTRPGGMCVLVTDVVSTTSAPALLHAHERDLKRYMADLVAARNFFTGVNPYRIVALLEEDPRFRVHLASARMIGPWLWAVTKDRQHLTCAIVARRQGA